MGGVSVVVATRCARYDPVEVEGALRRLLAPLGGMAAFVQPGERIALKPNLLMGAPPEKAVTTHPDVVAAVALAVREAGGEPVLMESPGSGIPYSAAALRRVYRRTGMTAMAERIGLELNLDTRVRAVSHPDAKLTKRLDVLTPLLEVDGVISLPKLKTHYFMIFTGAVKNLFGVVPGFAKPGYHAKLGDPRRFADMLLDIVSFVRPRLSVMDAVVGLEGDGPGTAGRPREIGALLASPDPVALDAAACALVGIPGEQVPTLATARERGLWSGSYPDVVWLGENPEALRVQGFVVPRSATGSAGMGPGPVLDRVAGSLMRELFSARPRPRRGRCTGCGTCERACPRQAITVHENLAYVDDDRCIRCYCCHELCPEAAIDLELGRMGRALRRVGLR